jgi:HlyD family secretion protein
LVISLVLLVGFLSFVAIKFIFKTTEYDFTTVKVQKGKVSNTITATGTLEATNTIEVGTQVSGVIEKLYVDFNSKVTKGQLIAELDKVTLQSSLETAEADLEKAQANFEYQAATLERNKVLYEKELLAKSDYDLVVYDYKTSKAEVKSAKANLDKAQRNLSYASIYSPIDGIVLNRAVEEGQTVAASLSTPEIYTITNDLSVMQVEADIDEADIGQLRVGQRVEFTVDAFPDLTFEGSVSEIRLQPTETSNVITYTTIISVNNPDLNLKPGMTASITAYVEEVNDVLVIAAKAMRFTPDHEMLKDYMKSMPEDLQMPMGRPQGSKDNMAGDGMQGRGEEGAERPELDESHKMVWVKEDDGIRPVQVEIGIDDGTNVEVISGIEEGTEVITAMAVSIGDSSQNDNDGEEDQKSPFIQEGPSKNAGGGPPR